MIANKVYTREEMREERIHTADYRFIDKAGEYTAALIMRAEASSGMLRLFFRLSDGRKIILVAEIFRLLRNRQRNKSKAHI